MGNTIKRTTMFVETMAKLDTNSFIGGECVGWIKQCDRWCVANSEHQMFRGSISQLRNEDYFDIIKQYSEPEIILELTTRYPDAQTVYLPILQEKFEDELYNSGACTIDELCDYIATNLI